MTGHYLLICSLTIRIYESRYIEIFIDFDVIDIKYVTYVSDQLTFLNLICIHPHARQKVAWLISGNIADHLGLYGQANKRIRWMPRR
jgi:hypothetical protein